MLYHILALVFALAQAPTQAQQPPWRARNLKYFPADITRGALVQRMREFSLALDVRCQYCHSGGDGVSLDGVDFSSDDKTAKVKARAMLRMTDEINRTLLPKVPSRVDPPVEVECATCHRGRRTPKSLQTTLFEIVAADGAPAAIAKYRELRNAGTERGKYDFGEWEINELARRLVVAKDPRSAVAILEMNGEYHPKSASIDFQIGELQLGLGDKDKALLRYKAALQKDPELQPAKARIAELEKK